MSAKSIARSIVIMTLLTALPAIPAAAAGIEKMVSDCGAGTCHYDSAAISAPAGWVHDEFAERTMHMKVLVRDGQSFASADSYILATVLPNLDNVSIADHVFRGQKYMRLQVPDLKIKALPDMARAKGKAAFLVYQYEKPNATKRRFERIATTMDSDKDGNAFVVGISLTADSAQALQAAEASYLEILRRY
jgi:hypothetical protein